MIEEEKSCEQIIVQITAVKAAIDKIGLAIVESFAEECIMNVLEKPESVQLKVKDISKMLMKLTK